MLTKEGGIKYYYHHEKCYFVERSIATYSHCISAHNRRKICAIKKGASYLCNKTDELYYCIMNIIVSTEITISVTSNV